MVKPLNTKRLRCVQGLECYPRTAECVNERTVHPAAPEMKLLRLATLLLAVALTRQRLLRPALVARLEVEGVLLDVLDDVLLLHLALETTQGRLNGLAFLDLHLGHLELTSSLYGVPGGPKTGRVNMLGYHTSLPLHPGKLRLRRNAQGSLKLLKTGRMQA